jgi:hypothetical protein
MATLEGRTLLIAYARRGIDECRVDASAEPGSDFSAFDRISPSPDVTFAAHNR